MPGEPGETIRTRTYPNIVLLAKRADQFSKAQRFPRLSDALSGPFAHPTWWGTAAGEKEQSTRTHLPDGPAGRAASVPGCGVPVVRAGADEAGVDYCRHHRRAGQEAKPPEGQNTEIASRASG